jgi:hypothetical protein
VRFKEEHDKDTDSDESWEENQYELSPRGELCEFTFPKEIVVPWICGW